MGFCPADNRVHELFRTLSAMNRAILAVTNDLATDQRVHRTALSLVAMGYEVLLSGREKKGSQALNPRPYYTYRFKLFFEKGPFFYAEYNIRLFFFLLFSKKTKLIVSNDLDTLPACFLASRIKTVPLLYDSHEYFTEVPELQGRPVVKAIWKFIERLIVPRLKTMITVSPPIAFHYREKYGVQVEVIHNYPPLRREFDRQEFFDAGNRFAQEGISNTNIILYQGVLNEGRGLEEAVEAMNFVDGGALVLIGDGDIRDKLLQQVKNGNLESKVKFFGRIPFEKLRYYTLYAKVGLVIEIPYSCNYKYSLSNKLFDYIHAGVPVLASSCIEILRIFDRYGIGMLIKTHEPQHIAGMIMEMLREENRIIVWKKNLMVAASEFCREREEEKFASVVKNIESSLIHNKGKSKKQ